ncbi:MAG TPA: gluconokinase [bacterium]|nr:gluconokinase [bacterium]
MGRKLPLGMSTVSARHAEAPVVLALDLGSSSVRAIGYDRLGREIDGSEGRLAYSWQRTPDGGVEIDPEAILDGTFAAIDRALVGLGDRAPAVCAVGISTFWHNIMGIDPAGRPVTPLYSWADERGAGAAADLRARFDQEALWRRTGCVFHPSYPAARLLWLRDAFPDRHRAAARWVSVGEYLALRCFGRTACSISMASGTGLLDQRRCTWDEELLAALGLTTDRLSPLVDLDTPFRGLRPPFEARWPALAEIPWLPAAGDGALANIGTGCVGPERAALSIGTTGAIRVLRSGPVPDVPPGLWVYRADRSRVLAGGALSNGGSVHRWVQDRAALGASEDVDRALLDRPPDGHGLVVLPFFAGERSPDWPLAVRGAIVGMTLRTDPLDLMQAALEAVAYRFALIWDLVREAFPEVRVIVASGGAPARSPAWMQIIADVFGHEVVVSDEAEGSSRGAALLALEAVGASRLDAAPAAPGRVYAPDVERHARYREARARQRRVETALAPLHRLVTG